MGIDRIKKANYRKWVFIGGMTTGVVLFWIAVYCIRWEVLTSVFFGNPNDTFMDFFKVIICGKAPYTMHQMIYPPLMHCIFGLLGKIILINILQSGPFDIYDSQIGMMVYFLWMILQILIFSELFQGMYNGDKLSQTTMESKVVTFLVILSEPFIFCFERGNSTLFALDTLMVFLIGYKSENRFIRFISFLCLALSAGVKVYPALFELLLIREKKWKQAIELIFLGAFCALAPFGLLTGADRNPLTLLGNMGYTRELYNTLSLGFRHDIMNDYRILEVIFNHKFDVLPTISSAIVALSCIVFVLFKPKLEQWKMLNLICLTMILATGLNYTYTLTFMAIPLAYFLTAEKNNSGILQAVYALLYVLIFTPCFFNPTFGPRVNAWCLRLSSGIESIALAVMYVILILDEAIDWIKEKNKDRCASKLSYK